MPKSGVVTGARRSRGWVTLAAALLPGCASGPRAPVAYFVPANAEASERQDAGQCFKDCRTANPSDDARFECMRACSGIVVAENRSCSQVGQSEYVSCVDREETLREGKKPWRPWALIAAIGVGVLCTVFIATSSSFEERSAK